MYSFQKMDRRKKALRKAGWTPTKVERVSAILNKEYTSSDEEEVTFFSDQPHVARVKHSLSWESEELKECKKSLDSIFISEIATSHQRRYMMQKKDAGKASTRTAPRNAPSWCIYSDSEDSEEETVLGQTPQ